MVALAQCPVIQEHDAHDWSFKLVIDGDYVPKYFYCSGVQLHLVDEKEYLHIEVETNPELFEKLIGQTQEEQPEASEERIIGEDKSSPELGGSLFTKESINGRAISSAYVPMRVSISPELQMRCVQVLAETLEDPTAYAWEKREAAQTLLEFQMRSID